MTDSRLEGVKRQVASLPDSPGVYLWKDGNGQVIYVGKAKRLKTRVRSYLKVDHTTSPKNRMLHSRFVAVDTIVVPSESQALLLENNLIKEYQPRFNVSLKDDKTYPSIAVTVAEPFPRVVVGRQLSIPGARYFGPYTDVGMLRRTLHVIRRIFTVRSCHYKLMDEVPDRACLDYHIHRCLAPCMGWQDQRAYRAMIGDVLAFLEGRTVEVRGRLRSRMETAADRLDFERAAEIRNSLRWLDQVDEGQSVEVVGGGDTDAVGFARDGQEALGVVVKVRDGKVIARDHRILGNLTDEPDAAVLTAFLVRFYLPSSDRARSLLLPFVPDSPEGLAELVDGTHVSVPKRGTNAELVALADQNARHLMEGLRIESLESDERAEDPVYALGRDLGMTSVPRHMVCIDISTSQGKDTVGSLVWFEGGRPKKTFYRRYKIEGEGKPDDFSAVHEVVTRFVRRTLDEDKLMPDLMVIDGGRGQLGAAKRALEELGQSDVPLVSLAKRDEEVFMVGRAESLRLSKRAPGLRLLQRARDEAHRFAVEFNRVRRRKRTITSTLLDIPGVGAERRRRLLKHFGSLAAIKTATLEEIQAVDGFSLKLAERVRGHIERAATTRVSADAEKVE